MKILVTGATGFVGRYLVNRLINEGHHVLINLLPGEKSPFTDKVETYVFYHDSIDQDIEYIKRKELNGIIHLASLYITNHQPNEVVNLIESNIKFGSYLLECASIAKVNWFINTGTFWQSYQNNENSPVNLYAATKQAFESIAQFYIKLNKIKFCTIRLSDTFGPSDSRPKIFNLWEKVAKTGESIDMSPGEQLIDISYIDDIISAFIILSELLKNKSPEISNGSVYAVKAKKRYTLKELSKVFEKVTGYKLKINWGGRPYRDREVMVPWEQGISVPTWNPKISLEEGIKRTFKEV